MRLRSAARPFGATQQQVHDAGEQRNEHQRPDVDDQRGTDLVPNDGIELVTLAGRMEHKQHRPGNRDGAHHRNLRAAELSPTPHDNEPNPRDDAASRAQGTRG